MGIIVYCWALLLFCVTSAGAFADTITVGAEDDAAPWSYADGTGYVNDLVRAAYAAVNWQVRFEVMPYPRCKILTEEGSLTACFSASKTPDTAATLQFPQLPVFAARNVLYARADTPLTGCEPAAWGRAVSVGFVNEYEYIDTVVQLQKSGKIRSEIASSEVLLLRMLAARRFDAAVLTVDQVKRVEFLAAIAGVTDRFKEVCDFGAEPAYVAFSRKNASAPAALDAFNRGMAILTKNGSVKVLQTLWAKKALSIEAAKKH